MPLKVESEKVLKDLAVGEVIRLVRRNGWYHVRTRGSHRQYKHPHKTGIVTIAGHNSSEVKPGILNAILKQAGLR